MAAPRCITLLAAFPLVAACTGEISSLGANQELGAAPRQSTNFLCSTNVPAASALPRLSRTQYENSVRALLESELPSRAPETYGEIASALTLLPHDAVGRAMPFASMDQSVSQAHVDAWFAVGRAVALALTADQQRVDELLSCQQAETEDACVSRFFTRFARKAFHHTPSEAELALLQETYDAQGIDVDGLRDVITLALNAPQFVYRVEFGAEPAPEASSFVVKGSELAARLSFHLWQSAPDDALIARAESGELDQDFEAVVDEMLDDPRSEAATRAFVREWLDLDALRPLDALNGTPAFDAFVGKDKPSAQLRDAMIEDVLASFGWHMRQEDSYADWFASPYSFATDGELSALYGTPSFQDDGREPPRFPEGERAGLITRAALLATGTAKTRPIIKGVFLRDRILCDTVPPPPANATTVPDSISDSLSTREVVEELTEQPGSSCAACHSTKINPLGFATENFDALGRLRVNETIYAEDGSILAVKPVDTATVPEVAQGDDTPSRGAQDLSAQILASGKAEACFARQYIRFTHGRMEDESIDGCELEAVQKALQDARSLRQAVRAPLLTQTFRKRFLGEVQ